MSLSKLSLGFCFAVFAEAADILSPLADIAVGADLLEDIGASVAYAATEVPSIADMTGLLNLSFAAADSQQPQQLTPEQQQHIELAESFFLSPFGNSLAEMMALPKFANELVNRSSNQRTPNLRGNSAAAAATEAKESMPLAATGRLIGPLMPLQLQQYQNAMLQKMLQQKQDAVQAATRAAATQADRVLSPAVMAQLFSPMTILQMKEKQAQMMQEMLQQKQQQLQQQEQQREEQQEQQVEARAAQLEQQAEQQQEEQQQQPEQQQEQQVEARAEQQAEQQQEKQQQQPEQQLEEAAEAQVLAEEYGYDASEVQQKTPAEKAATAAEEEQENEKDASPQRFFLWSRTNPLGPLQPATDTLYLLNWAIQNPLSMIEFKADSFHRCMYLMQDAQACAKALKVDPYIVTHGGTNSAFRPATVPY